MANNIRDQVPENHVKELVKLYLSYLKKEGYTFFRGKPRIQAFSKGENLIGIALLESDNKEIEYKFVQEPSPASDYLIITLEELRDVVSLKEKGKLIAIDKIAFLQADNSYNTNLKRVDNLLESKHYAVALVFLVSAFESITQDLFFAYHQIWFIDMKEKR